MKLEVGKIYVSDSGNEYEMVGKDHHSFIGRWYDTVYLFNEDGVTCLNTDIRLVSEVIKPGRETKRWPMFKIALGTLSVTGYVLLNLVTALGIYKMNYNEVILPLWILVLCYCDRPAWWRSR